MTRDNCWLPKLELWDDYDNDYPQYQAALYEIFQNDFIKSRPTFEGKQVNIRRHPIEYACYVTPPPVPLPLSSVLIKRIGTPKLCANGWKFPKKRKKIEAALRSRKATSICFR